MVLGGEFLRVCGEDAEAVTEPRLVGWPTFSGSAMLLPGLTLDFPSTLHNINNGSSPDCAQRRLTVRSNHFS